MPRVSHQALKLLPGCWIIWKPARRQEIRGFGICWVFGARDTRLTRRVLTFRFLIWSSSADSICSVQKHRGLKTAEPSKSAASSRCSSSTIDVPILSMLRFLASWTLQACRSCLKAADCHKPPEGLISKTCISSSGSGTSNGWVKDLGRSFRSGTRAGGSDTAVETAVDGDSCRQSFVSSCSQRRVFHFFATQMYGSKD